ncbi:FAD/NAD-P-binding domain-containing protein [Stereum hirsutum FP-91666 SS1]|uniref:FAD/NAD-P-binding domain-containing protein n=1 Tax=Stereum hirsutum (strain FP-91666) TaxID=721885 RepID=R7RX14_STEHR|nr:FAD/NAD-P-binding domain-containing protein [Stereum hirsutum FP-91666 SS1]EIM79879.1 FAD/NAD-P-binding domain-containing protein [Stereum hirsutum FP-91666 SS1]
MSSGTAPVDTHPQLSLPTLTKLKSTVHADVSPVLVASEWLQSFTSAIGSNDIKKLGGLFLQDAFWKDILALSWDYRSIQGVSRILPFVETCAPKNRLTISSMAEDPYRSPKLIKLFPDLSWIQFGFALETSIGKGNGFARLVPTSSGKWKAYTVFTSLETLAGEKSVPSRLPYQEKHWAERRQREIELVDGDPSVLIIGGGHSGLELAARLGRFGVSNLVVEKNPRVGDNWRTRYKSLCLHDPVFYDQLPYLPYPSTWPIYTPRAKLADWIENYAQSLEINVWTSSHVSSALWLPDEQLWMVSVIREGEERAMKVKHLIFATGMGGGVPVIPRIPAEKSFNGQILHSASFTSAKDYIGKKVLVVGSGNSGHDIAQDLAEMGVEVTMLQRSSTYVISAEGVAKLLSGVFSETGPPTEIADRLNASFPTEMVKLLSQRSAPGIAATLDKEIHDKLKAVGFKLNLGPDNGGLLQLFLRRGGGYYVDVGASTMIAERKIGLKSGASIQEYTQHGVKFSDGSELSVDVVVYATGFGDPRLLVKDICGSDVADLLHPVWGLNEESELQSVWRDSGHPRLHFAIGKPTPSYA